MAPRVVLVVDHHDDSRVVYATILQYGGFVVLEARNGAEALEMASKLMPDAVIAEMTLPVVDGSEVLRRLKRHARTGHIPVIIVTADARAEVRQQAVEADCDAYFLKPCAPRELLDAVRAVLDQALPTALA